MRIVWLDRATFGPSLDCTRPRFTHEWMVCEKTPAADGQNAADLHQGELTPKNQGQEPPAENNRQ